MKGNQMTHEEIIESIKEQYTRDLRKQLVKSLLEHEKNKDQAAIRSGYQIMNQIFSYVLNKLGWTIADNADQWDSSPLDIMSEVFPKLETTQWFAQQQLQVKRGIELKIAEEAK
jgi:DNA-binding ferritin-like protein